MFEILKDIMSLQGHVAATGERRYAADVYKDPHFRHDPISMLGSPYISDTLACVSVRASMQSKASGADPRSVWPSRPMVKWLGCSRQSGLGRIRHAAAP